MDYASKLTKLEHLRALVERYVPLMYGSAPEARRLHQDICETYGQVADVFDEAVGKQRIEVPDRSDSGPSSQYPNYFEAGFLSGRSIHTHQGQTELLKVIGKVKQLLEGSSRARDAAAAPGARVFLVHGRNDAVLQSCARFIEKLEIPLTVLREEPSQGRTIIEKFIAYADVVFAVVLLTGDDRGGRADQLREQQMLRARQNVIFELGFFIGKLGRDRVCALYEDGVEVPSDYQGVAFVLLDPQQAWRLELAKEMEAAGLPVDLNKAM